MDAADSAWEGRMVTILVKKECVRLRLDVAET